jgi:hypothetical protein
MGLRDIIQGMKNGPRGQPQPSSSGSGGGMSRRMFISIRWNALEKFRQRHLKLSHRRARRRDRTERA